MKNILVVILLAFALAGTACSRSDKQPDAVPQTTAPADLKSDAERLQQATAKAAAERKKADESAPAPTATP